LHDDLELRLARAVPTRKVDFLWQLRVSQDLCAQHLWILSAQRGNFPTPIRSWMRSDGAIDPRLYAFRDHDVGGRYPADRQQQRSGQRHESQELACDRKGRPGVT